MRCLKAFGERIMARDPDPSRDIAAQCPAGNGQTAEIHIRIALMNRFPALGTAEITSVK